MKYPLTILALLAALLANAQPRFSWTQLPAAPGQGYLVNSQGVNGSWEDSLRFYGGFLRITGGLDISTVTALSGDSILVWRGNRVYRRSLSTALASYPTGSGTSGYVARWTGTTTLGTGALQDNGTVITANDGNTGTAKPFGFDTWTTAGRPTGVTGQSGYNTTTGGMEWYDASTWRQVPKSDVNAGTNGSVPYWWSGTLTQNNSGLFFSGSTSRFGVGTSSPSSHVHFKNAAGAGGLLVEGPGGGGTSSEVFSALRVGNANTGLTQVVGLDMFTTNTSGNPGDIYIKYRSAIPTTNAARLHFYEGSTSAEEMIRIESGGKFIIRPQQLTADGFLSGSTWSLSEFAISSNYNDIASRPHYSAFRSHVVFDGTNQTSFSQLYDNMSLHYKVGQTPTARAVNYFSQIDFSGVSPGGNTYHAIYQTDTVRTFSIAYDGKTQIGGSTDPARMLHVTGEARITDLTTDTPTLLVGADGDGDLNSVTVGSGLTLSGGSLTTSSSVPTGSGTATAMTVWNTSSTLTSTTWYIDSGNLGASNLSPSYKLDMGLSTDGLRLPNGTTAQRPTGANGVIRYNSTTGYPEVYYNSTWNSITGGGGGIYGGSGTVPDGTSATRAGTFYLGNSASYLYMTDTYNELYTENASAYTNIYWSPTYFSWFVNTGDGSAPGAILFSSVSDTDDAYFEVVGNDTIGSGNEYSVFLGIRESTMSDLNFSVGFRDANHFKYIYIPIQDSTANAINFYDNKYAFPNATPTSDGTAYAITWTNGTPSFTAVGGSSTNIYNTSSTLTGNRILSGGSSYYLSLEDLTSFYAGTTGGANFEAYSGGGAIVSGFQVTTSHNYVYYENSATNDVLDLLKIGRTTSDVGGSANGFGAGIVFNLEDDGASTADAASIQAAWTDATNSAASGEIIFNVRTGGTMAQEMSLDGTGVVLEGNQVRLGGASGPLVISGSGSPEGVVTAPVGSMYLRTDGGAGTSMYVKESGTGNTGWVAK